ncbi:unnamed protein product, partial [Ectocarpus sp. 8 AP-2014]
MLDVVGELRHLGGLDGTAPKSPTPGRKVVRGGYTPRSVSPMSKGKRSPGPAKGGGLTDTNEPPSTELVGATAEESGLWLSALRAAVSTVRSSSHFVPAFVQDFESAGGYETVGYM